MQKKQHLCEKTNIINAGRATTQHKNNNTTNVKRTLAQCKKRSSPM
jgi:hypothetical protein